MEIGGCCLSSSCGDVAVSPSKVDRIMSRFRPIAPKPVAPTVPCSVSEYSGVSVDASGCRQALDVVGRSRRARKRRGDALASPRPTKRGSSRSDCSKERSSGGNSAAGSVATTAGVARSQNNAFSTGVLLPANAFSSTELSEASVMGGVSAIASRAIGCGLLPRSRMDAGFMERAAATLRERRITSRGFTEMIRAITRLPTSADVHNLMQQRSRSTAEAVPRSSPGGLAIDGIYGDRENAVAQQRNGYDLVTLPLLPNTPSRAASSLSSIAHIQQIHSNSSEPILLLDDARRIVWLNRAYERALKDSIGRHAAVGPFIDPLGIPTQLGRFSLQLDGCSSGTTTSVTLWGFLKKIVAVGAASGSFSGFPVKNGSFLDGFSLKDGLHATPTTGVAQQQLQDCCEAGRNSGGVIVPQPIRLVGSTVLLESITDMQQEPALQLPESLEALKKQLEEGTWPAFISDSGSNLVRWVNTTYKQMVGQPECPWLASAVSSSKLGDGGGASAMPRLMGEILLTCSVEVPPSAPAFSGRANIQWTKNSGERSCITVPCDVSRLDGISCCNGKVMLLWKFHVHASLRLTSGI